MLRGHWCHIIVLNVQAPKEDKIDNVNGIFETLTLTFCYEISNAKGNRKDIFKPTKGNESLHEISNDNGVRVVNFATSKKTQSQVKSALFPRRNFHKYQTLFVDLLSQQYCGLMCITSTPCLIGTRATGCITLKFHKYAWKSPDGKPHNQIHDILTER
jgi:hypothetical protein